MAEAHPDKTFPYPIPARYQCIKLLGHGGSGLVYKAYDQRLKRDVAIKFARSPSIVSRHRLVNEARLLSSVNHPALCRVFDIGEPEVPSSSLFMVLEYLEGEPLSKAQGSMSTQEAIRVTNSLVDAVCRMHEAGYAHNDINPHNIMIRSSEGTTKERRNNVALVDLSIAAPSSPVTIQRDIYQLSALLLSLLTGMKPEPFFQQPVARRSQLPSGLGDIIKRALSLEPNASFRNCRDFQKALNSWFHRYKLKQRFLKIGAANAAILATVILIFVFLREPTTAYSLQGYSTDKNQYAHAVVFAHYSRHLVNDGYLQQATEQAELALTHFDDAVSNDPDNIQYHTERANFILDSEHIFSPAQVTTMLLNAVNELGEPINYEDEPGAHYLRAKIYLGLAKINSEQPHLVEQWADSASQSAKAAINSQPNVDRYQKLNRQISQYQSNGGTD
ncbi:MAG: serine/threonine protein kinase [Pseudomonadota bacterium]